MKFIYKKWKYYYFLFHKMEKTNESTVNFLSARLPTLKETIMLILGKKTTTVTCFEAVKFQ